jgi:hypothetical protein
LKRFIEPVFEHKKQKHFDGKNATCISTSGKFYDNLAHHYIQAISEDFGMNYTRGYSAEMMDLLKENERKRLQKFVMQFFTHCKNKVVTSKHNEQLVFNYPEYTPTNIKTKQKTEDYKITVITDATDSDVSLNNMIDTFVKLMPCEISIINVHEMDLKGGCLGCLKCAAENICFYPDAYMKTFEEKIVAADGLVYAFQTLDRYYSARMKTFLDRTFFNGHRPILKGQQQAYFVSGPLRQMPELRSNLEVTSEVGRANFVGIVSDEYSNSSEITILIQTIIDDMLRGIKNDKYTGPKTFLGVGGHKVFRDLIHTYQIVFPQDYKYYKKEKLFDWPKIFFREFGIFIRPLMKLSSFRRRFYSQAEKQQTRIFNKVIKKEIFD